MHTGSTGSSLFIAKMKWKEDGKVTTSTGSTKKNKDATGSTGTKNKKKGVTATKGSEKTKDSNMEVPSTQGNVFSGQIPDMDASK